MKYIAKSALLVCCLLAMLPLNASAVPNVGAIDVWVVPIGQISGVANNPLSYDNVANTIGGMLAARGYRWHRISGGPLAAGTTTVRVMYIVTNQSGPGGPAVAAAASTGLLQTVNVAGGNITISLYHGLQQSVSQRSTPAAAQLDVNRGFVEQLRVRINAALDRLESQ